MSTVKFSLVDCLIVCHYVGWCLLRNSVVLTSGLSVCVGLCVLCSSVLLTSGLSLRWIVCAVQFSSVDHLSVNVLDYVYSVVQFC